MYSSVFLSFIILFGIFVGGPAHARQILTDAERQAVIDQEMDCIAESLNAGDGVSWQTMCSSVRSSGGYDIAKSDNTFDYKNDDYINLTQRKRMSTDFPEIKKEVDKRRSGRYEYPQLGGSAVRHPYSSMDLQQHGHQADTKTGRFLQADFRFLSGYREDEFDFNFASDITGNVTPNIISEVTWSDLKMTQIKAETDIIIGDRFVLDGMFAYADIFQGDNQDSDYDGDNRTDESSRSDNSSDDGEAMDWSAGVGYRFPLGSKGGFLGKNDVWLTILGGYSYHELNLIMEDGFQTIPATGDFDGLHSNFWADWRGPWAGVALEGAIDKFSGIFRFKYHVADYYASANWNLRSDFQHPTSFAQWADARGLVFNLGAMYNLTESWILNMRLEFQDWETEDGIIRFFNADGTRPEQRLNEANWESRVFMLGSTYHF